MAKRLTARIVGRKTRWCGAQDARTRGIVEVPVRRVLGNITKSGAAPTQHRLIREVYSCEFSESAVVFNIIVTRWSSCVSFNSSLCFQSANECPDTSYENFQAPSSLLPSNVATQRDRL